MDAKIKAALKQEAKSVGSSLEAGARSGSYLYPFKGLLYFLYHKSLWRPFLSRAWQTLTVGLSVTTTMFFFTYVPQAALLAFTSGPVAAVSAALLVLSESSTIVNLVSRLFLVADSLTDTFDGTLVARGHERLVAQGRQLEPSVAGRDPIARLGWKLKQPFAKFRPQELLRSLIYLPLNFVPIVGIAIYAIAQGKRIGPLAHTRYFQLKGWDEKEKEEWVKRHRPAYTSFGVMAFILEMVPFASMVFSYTNTVGAALWASDIERIEQGGAR